MCFNKNEDYILPTTHGGDILTNIFKGKSQRPSHVRGIQLYQYQLSNVKTRPHLLFNNERGKISDIQKDQLLKEVTIMATKKVNYNSMAIKSLPNNKSVLYRIKTKTGNDNYIGVASKGNVINRIAEHLGEIPGSNLIIEQFHSIKDARNKEVNLIKRNKPKYNKK